MHKLAGLSVGGLREWMRGDASPQFPDLNSSGQRYVSLQPLV